nr:immunoglobulin heavy chain junction region [Macaca mulatta]MOY30193.1 immunoglobulin heavy chain junction region [Macaca mulatta]
CATWGVVSATSENNRFDVW